MASLRTLLVATDFSPHAGKAVERAALLAQELNAELSVLHVIESQRRDSKGEDPEKLEVRDEVIGARERQELELLRSNLIRNYGIKVNVVLREGKVFNEVLAASDQTDLLVVGALGNRPWKDFFIGTTADQLIRTANTPILVVKNNPQTAYKKITVPTDFSEVSKSALRLSLLFAPTAETHVIHVCHTDYERQAPFVVPEDPYVEHFRDKCRENAAERIQEFLSQLQESDRRKIIQKVGFGDPGEVILQEQIAESGNLLVIGKRGKSRLGDMLIGSVTQRILSEAPCDVLVVPNGVVY